MAIGVTAVSKVVVGTSIRPDQLAQLDRVAEEHQVNRSIVIRWAIDAYLDALFLSKRPLNQPDVTLTIQVPETAA